MDFFKKIGEGITNIAGSAYRAFTEPFTRPSNPLIANIGSTLGGIGSSIYGGIKSLFGATTAVAPTIASYENVFNPQPGQVSPSYARQIREQTFGTPTTQGTLRPPTPVSNIQQFPYSGGFTPGTSPFGSPSIYQPIYEPPSGKAGEAGQTAGQTAYVGGARTSIPGGIAGTTGISRPPISGFSSAGTTGIIGPVSFEEEQRRKKAEQEGIRITPEGRQIAPEGFQVISGLPGGQAPRLRDTTTGRVYAPSNDQRGNLVLIPEDYASAVREPFAAGNVPDTIETQALLQATDEALRNIMSDPSSFTQEGFLALKNQKALALYRAKGPPPPDGLVWESLTQSNFINSSKDPTGLRATIDNIRRQYNEPQLQSEKANLQNIVDAATQATRDVIKQIKDNPELPASLAKRRIDFVVEDLEFQLKPHLNRLTQLRVELEQVDKLVNREIGIVEKEETARERARDNARQLLNALISSGGLSLYSEDMLSQLAGAIGIPTASLTAIKSSLGTEEKYSSITTNEDAQGNLVFFGVNKKTGGIEQIASYKGFAKTGQTEAEKKLTAAIQRFSGTISAGINAGLNPESIVALVNKQANATGVILDIPEQNAVLQAATQLQAQLQEQKLREPLTVQPPDVVNQSNEGFFSRLWNWITP